MQLRTLYYNKKYYDLLIKYIHFDEYGSDNYEEEVKRVEQIFNNYEPVAFKLNEIVQIIRSVFKDNNENYLHVELSNHAQTYEVDFYDEKLENYVHTMKRDTYVAKYNTQYGCSFEMDNIENSNMFMNTQKEDIEMIKSLSCVRPEMLTNKMAKLMDLYEAFYGRKIDVMSENLEEELTYMLYLISQYEINLSRREYYYIENNKLLPNEDLKQLIFKLKLFVNPMEEKAALNQSLNEYVRRGVEGMGTAIATHFETRSPEQQLAYLKDLCMALRLKPQDELVRAKTKQKQSHN